MAHRGANARRHALPSKVSLTPSQLLCSTAHSHPLPYLPAPTTRRTAAQRRADGLTEIVTAAVQERRAAHPLRFDAPPFRSRSPLATLVGATVVLRNCCQ